MHASIHRRYASKMPRRDPPPSLSSSDMRLHCSQHPSSTQCDGSSMVATRRGRRSKARKNYFGWMGGYRRRRSTDLLRWGAFALSGVFQEIASKQQAQAASQPASQPALRNQSNSLEVIAQVAPQRACGTSETKRAMAKLALMKCTEEAQIHVRRTGRLEKAERELGRQTDGRTADLVETTLLRDRLRQGYHPPAVVADACLHGGVHGWIDGWVDVIHSLIHSITQSIALSPLYTSRHLLELKVLFFSVL